VGNAFTGNSLSEIRNLTPVTRHPHLAMEKNYFVHESSYVDEPCEIGEGTKIWHFSHVMAGSKIGRRCNIGQNVVVSPDVRIGDNVKIQNNVSVYTGVELEDDVFCGPSMVFTNVANPRSHVSRKDEYRKTLVKRGATIGANATVVCGNTIGRFAFIGAGAVVTRDVPDYALVVGNPGRIVGWSCRCGVRLDLARDPQEGDDAICSACGAAYVKRNGAVSEAAVLNTNSSSRGG
jgi:UDP-2-acetamido-3-amino-2,3-dideoxy-glucuronate N-acetyltransferase